MPRPRQHPCAAAKQAAYRTRLRDTTTLVDRAALDHLHAKLETLQEVIHAAARQGDPLAQRCRAGSTDTTLDKLIAVFQERPPQSPPAMPLKRKQVGHWSCNSRGRMSRTWNAAPWGDLAARQV